MRSAIVGAATALTLALGACVPTQIAPSLARPIATISLGTIPGTHLRTMRVKVAGDSSDFLFDTGNGTTLIDQSIVSKIGCTPGGNGVGFRMTGEKLSGPRCDSVPVAVGGVAANLRAGIVDMAALLGRSSSSLHGAVSLALFRGRTITLDLAHNRLIVESEASARDRVRQMHEIPARLATGMSGEDLDVFVATRVKNSDAWLEWDSGHQASTFIAPHIAKLFGLTDNGARADVSFVWGGDSVVTPVQVHDIIYDGVLSAAYIERATWTVDLASGRMWVSGFADIPALPSSASAVAPPAANPAGIYNVQTAFGSNVQHSVMSITGEKNNLRGTIRGIGEEEVLPLGEVTFRDSVLSYRLPLRQPVNISVRFSGLEGTGDWTFGTRPAHTVAVKVR